MKTSLLLVALCAAPFVPAFGAPDAAPKTPAKPVAKPAAKTPVKAVADPLDIPAFAPIPTEFVFAGTQKDVYKLLKRYTGGVSLADVPEPTTEELVASKDNETLQDLIDLKHLVATLHVVRVRSVSYFALDEAAQDEAYKKLAPKTAKDDPNDFDFSVRNRGEARSQELLTSAETFYKEMLAKQGGKI